MASAILLVLAAASAASVAAERAVLSELQHRQLVQVHAANWMQEFPNESYENVSNLAKKLEDVTSGLKEKLEGDLEKRSQDSERTANDYGALLTGLSDGLHQYGRTIDDFRSLEQQRQRKHTEEVRKVLTGKEHSSSLKTQKPEAVHDEVAGAESSSTTEESKTKHETEDSTNHHEMEDEEGESSEETDDDEDEEEEVPEAQDTKAAQEEMNAINKGDFEQNMMDDEKVEAVTQAVQKVGREAKLIKNCFDLMGDPVESQRTCKSSFKKDYCKGRDPISACKKARKECTVKYVCKGKDNSINSVDGSWKIEETVAACGNQNLEARATCVPKAGDYKLPLLK